MRTCDAEEAVTAVETNIVYFEYEHEHGAATMPPVDLEAALARHGVLLAGGYTPSSGSSSVQRFRAVLHRGVPAEAVHAAIDAVSTVLSCT